MENLPNSQELASRELKELYEADQADRDVDLDNIDTDFMAQLKIKDANRLARVEELYNLDLLKTAEDLFHAAMIFQHGGNTESYKKAFGLSKQSMELGNKDGKELYPKAEDRYLLSIGKPQIWGTQYSRNVNTEPWKLKEPFDKNAKTEEERREMGVDIEKRSNELNKR